MHQYCMLNFVFVISCNHHTAVHSCIAVSKTGAYEPSRALPLVTYKSSC